MWQKDKGILLGFVRHNDKTGIAHIFTLNDGYVPFIYHLSTSVKGQRRNSLLQPLTLVGFESQIMQGRDLQHMKDPANAHPFTSIPFNPVKSCIALFLGEFLSCALRREECNRPLFRLLEKSIVWLDSTDDPANIHIYTMLQVAALIGIRPNTDDFQPGFWFDLQSGRFGAQPSHQDCMSPELAWKTVQLLNCEDVTESENIKMTGSERAGLISLLNTYFRIHVPGFPVLKSVDVLKSVFS